MYDQPNELESTAHSDLSTQRDESVKRLASEVVALRAEIAALRGALHDIQSQQQTPVRGAASVRPRVEPPVRPSPAPAATVVLLAAGLLSWQLLSSPRLERAAQPQTHAAERTTNPAASGRAVHATNPVDVPATEPPVTPLVMPTVYRGTLAIAAAQPGARVFVNRREVGVAPVRVRNLKAGAHLVWIERDGYRRWTRVVTVPAERVTRVTAALEPLDVPAEH
ncbi:MAG TPA: PEGA domain-containing protein [Vicinamibacterales bacterium]|nr:PEGA domain-containing protein [Vicinamibacterales bacterium]